MLNTLNDIEVLINKLLKLALESADINIEFDKVSIEHVIRVFKKVMLLLSEVLYKIIEFSKEMLHALEVVLTQSLELLYGGK